ncbi:MAG: hypothetical protein WD770_07525 [Actinomycetota bacterium]
MISSAAPATLAHPFVEAIELPVSPLVASLIAAAIVAALAYRWPAATRRAEPASGPFASWEGPLGPGRTAARIAAIGLAVLAVVAGRMGPDSELRNLAPALLVGAGWPLLVLASAVAGPVWRWLDPWDGVARALAPGAPATAPSGVHPAAVPAAAWAWYLVAFRDSLRPGTVALVFGAYSIATIIGALATGRGRWLGACEPIGLVFSWIARLPRRALTGWTPPPGAELVLGVLAGGLVLGLFRDSSLAPPAVGGSLAVVAASAAGGALVVLAGRIGARRGAAGSVAAGMVPALAGVAVALALARNRLLVSVQLLPGLASDPLGRGWDLFGTADWSIEPSPLGVAGRAAVQVAVLLAGHVAGAVVVARRTVDVRARDAGAVALTVSAGLSVAAVTAV